MGTAVENRGQVLSPRLRSDAMPTRLDLDLKPLEWRERQVAKTRSTSEAENDAPRHAVRARLRHVEARAFRGAPHDMIRTKNPSTLKDYRTWTKRNFGTSSEKQSKIA